MPTTKREALRWHRFYRTHSMREVAAEFGTTAATVSTTFARHGLPVRDRSERSPDDRVRRHAAAVAALVARGPK